MLQTHSLRHRQTQFCSPVSKMLYSRVCSSTSTLIRVALSFLTFSAVMCIFVTWQCKRDAVGTVTSVPRIINLNLATRSLATISERYYMQLTSCCCWWNILGSCRIRVTNVVKQRSYTTRRGFQQNMGFSVCNSALSKFTQLPAKIRIMHLILSAPFSKPIVIRMRLSSRIIAKRILCILFHPYL